MICSSASWGDIVPALKRAVLVGLIQAMKEQNDNSIDVDYHQPVEELQVWVAVT